MMRKVMPGTQGYMYRVARRDRLVEFVSNWLLNHIATEDYRAFVGVLIMRGHADLSKGVLATGKETDHAE